MKNTSRVLKIQYPFLHIPVKPGAGFHYLGISSDSVLIHDFRIEISAEDIGFWTFFDVGKYVGAELRLTIESEDAALAEKLLGCIRQGEGCARGNPLFAGLYQEELRPRFHFTSRRGWLNDPNGLVYQDGVYHLFYQHNPFGTQHGDVNVSWGHAVSRDLVHWDELSDAICPWTREFLIASGSAVIDDANTSGFGLGAMVAAFTGLGSRKFDGPGDVVYPSAGQFICASRDCGLTWTACEGNPAIPTRDGESWRDPRILRYEPEDKWVIVVYEVHDGRNCAAFYSSPDLRHWDYMSDFFELYECPDFFELACDGEPQTRKWVLYGADGRYYLGSFDGRVFSADTERQYLDFGKNHYAAQTWSNNPIEDGRRLHIAWMPSDAFEGMAFNQQMTVVTALSLRRSGGSLKVCKYPTKELESQRACQPEMINRTVAAGSIAGIRLYEAADLELQITGLAGTVEFNIGPESIKYDAKAQSLDFGGGKTCMLDILPRSGLNVRILADTTSFEIFFNGGEAAASYHCPLKEKTVELSADGSFAVAGSQWALRSIWQDGQ